jgi:membrane-bound lytic murein transglycosylase D
MTPDPSSRDPRSPRLPRNAGRAGGWSSGPDRALRGIPRPVRRVFGGTTVLAVVLLGVAATGERAPDSPATPGIEVPDVSHLLGETRLPIEVNARVERWIGRFLGPDRETFEHYLVREGLYGGMVRQKLRARDMPEQLLYLAMIESGFSAGATSPVAAAGMWQFLGATARAYGLSVDAWVDERRDPVRATDAALDYLEELHAEFGSWYLAAAAYNAGPVRVAAAVRRLGGTADETDAEAMYWRIIEDLPRETREFVPKILAAAILAEQAGHFGIDVEPDLPYLFDQVLVPGGTSLRHVAEALDESPALLRELNPHLIRGATPPGRSFPVRIPLGESHRVLAALPRG